MGMVPVGVRFVSRLATCAPRAAREPEKRGIGQGSTRERQVGQAMLLLRCCIIVITCLHDVAIVLLGCVCLEQAKITKYISHEALASEDRLGICHESPRCTSARDILSRARGYTALPEVKL
jgi:hypothetical protein